MNWFKTAQKAGWQKGWNDQFGDSQRYMYDAYDCSAHVTQLENKKLTVSAVLQHFHFGLVVYQDFWRFEEGQIKQAQECFKQVKETVGKVFDEFRTNSIPNNLMHTYLREQLRFIFPQNKPSSRIPHIDWSREQAGVSDWRNSIYGNRYPTTEIDGF